MVDEFSGFPLGELSDRSKKTSEAAAKAGLDGLLILQDCDLYYFTSTAQNGALFIPKEGEGVFFVTKDFERAKAESSFPNITSINSLKELPKALKANNFGDLKKIGLEFDVLPIKNYRYLERLFPNTTFEDASPLIRKIRSTKSPLEVELHLKAAAMHSAMFEILPSLFFPGAREIDISAAIEAFFRKSGHQGVIRMRGFGQRLFYGLVLSGASGAVPSTLDGPASGPGLSPAFPQGASTKIIERDDAIMVDMVSVYAGYIADGARMLYIGDLPEKGKEAYDAALAIEEKVLSCAKPMATTGEIYSEAKEVADKSGFGDNFMGIKGKNAPFVAHGIGLELDELPVISKGGREKLSVGNVIALEPKFIFEDIGAVGVENSYFIGPDGPELLTKTTITPIKIEF